MDAIATAIPHTFQGAARKRTSRMYLSFNRFLFKELFQKPRPNNLYPKLMQHPNL
jgi:hypothetical protein